MSSGLARPSWPGIAGCLGIDKDRIAKEGLSMIFRQFLAPKADCASYLLG